MVFGRCDDLDAVGESDTGRTLQLLCAAYCILREHGLPDRIADGVLLAGIDAHLTSEHANGIGTLASRAVVPALYC